jgi:cobyrinic acid a,c-diamide synthase
VLHLVGARVSGHEFHRTTVTPRAGEAAWAWTGAQPEGFVHGAVHASFLHTHPVAHPAAVARFVASCLKS